ncbi:phosducin a [Gadus macrocephalus]|uniref:phosducin a n=1 Tax=Gadus macrocephalus TaxID=80720 RepID=UPI0028CB4647|nr:phosducin a [Gadus macrocephalus]
MCCDEEEDEGKSVSLPSPDRPHSKDHRVKTTAALPETHQPKEPSRMSNSAHEGEELPVNYTGPKGVINDWRRFRLDLAEQPVRRELLRQMSREEGPERPGRKMSVQECELVQQQGERGLRRYRRQCMQEMHQRLSFGPTFTVVLELLSGEHFLEVVEQEPRALVVVHIYQPGVTGCEEMNSSLDCLASEYPSVKFCRIDAVATGAIERFSSDVLPALLVYRAGELLGNFLSVTKHFNQEFFATDVEALLNQYGLLPEKEIPASPGEEGEEEEEEEEQIE